MVRHGISTMNDDLTVWRGCYEDVTSVAAVIVGVEGALIVDEAGDTSQEVVWLRAD
jgi:hypothetical protein